MFVGWYCSVLLNELIVFDIDKWCMYVLIKESFNIFFYLEKSNYNL